MKIFHLSTFAENTHSTIEQSTRSVTVVGRQRIDHTIDEASNNKMSFPSYSYTPEKLLGSFRELKSNEEKATGIASPEPSRVDDE